MSCSILYDGWLYCIHFINWGSYFLRIFIYIFIVFHVEKHIIRLVRLLRLLLYRDIDDAMKRCQLSIINQIHLEKCWAIIVQNLMAYTSTDEELYPGFLGKKVWMCVGVHNTMRTTLYSQRFNISVLILCRPGLTTWIYIWKNENGMIIILKQSGKLLTLWFKIIYHINDYVFKV